MRNSKTIESFDFKGQLSRLNESEVTVIDSIYREWALLSQDTLSEYAGTKVEIEYIQFQQMPFALYLQKLSLFLSLSSFSLQFCENQGFLRLDTNLLFAFSNELLGTPLGSHFSLPSDLQMAITRKIIALLLTKLHAAWKDTIDEHFSLLEFSLKNQDEIFYSSQTLYGVGYFHLMINGVKGLFELTIPLSSLKLLLHRAKLPEISIKETEIKNLDNLSFKIEAKLGQTNLDLHEKESLQVGDVIILDQKTQDPIAFEIGKQKLGSAIIGFKGYQKSIKIESFNEDI
jgi:flagellar motor switch protein FliM